MTKYRTQTVPVLEQDLDHLHRRIDELERLITTLSVLGGSVGAGGGGTLGVTCGLTFSPSSISMLIPTGDTGQMSEAFTVTSSVAQTVTFTPTIVGSAPGCIGTPTVTPSVVTFTAGGTATILVTVPYTNCTDSGTVINLSLSASTSTGCTATGVLIGTATTTNQGMFAMEINCTNWIGGCVPINTWVSAISDGPTDWYGGCYHQWFGLDQGKIRLRSINGFTGEVDVHWNDVNACGWSDWSHTLSAGETYVYPPGYAYVSSLCYTWGGGYSSTIVFGCNSLCTATATASGVSNTPAVSYSSTQNTRDDCQG